VKKHFGSGLIPRTLNVAPIMERKSELLKEALEQLAASDAFDFSRFFDAAMDGAYTHSLWGAAYLNQSRMQR
jgi:hypothetical protein